MEYLTDDTYCVCDKIDALNEALGYLLLDERELPDDLVSATKQLREQLKHFQDHESTSTDITELAMSKYIESTNDIDFSECGLQALEVAIREEAYPIIERNFEKLAYYWIMCMYLKTFALGDDIMGIYEWFKHDLLDVMIVLSYRCSMKQENEYATIEDGTLHDILVHVSEKYTNKDTLRNLMDSYNPMIIRMMSMANYPVKRDNMEKMLSAFDFERRFLLEHIGRCNWSCYDYIACSFPFSREKERFSAKEICERMNDPACCGLLMLTEKENELLSICKQKPSFKQAKKENGEWTFPKWAIREYVKRSVEMADAYLMNLSDSIWR